MVSSVALAVAHENIFGEKLKRNTASHYIILFIFVQRNSHSFGKLIKAKNGIYHIARDKVCALF